MTRYTDLRASRPVRHFVALSVYRAIWWPVVAVLVPFALIAVVVDWLSWTAFPAVGRAAQPLTAAAHKGALAVGNAILGHDPKEPRQ